MAVQFSEPTMQQFQALLPRYAQKRAALLPTLWLAQEEFKAVLARLADHVERFDVTERVWRRNNALHGLERLQVSVR